jgi:hypothetical protein
MKKVTTLVFALAMMLSGVFISSAISGDNSFSAAAQTVTVRKRNRGVASRTYRGGKYVAHKVVRGTRYTAHKVKVGTKWTAHKTKVGTKWTAHKTKRGAKATVSRTKKIFN